MHFFLRIFDEFFSGFRAKFQKIVTCVAFSITFAKTNQKFAENSEFCEKKIHYFSKLFTSLLTPDPLRGGHDLVAEEAHLRSEVNNFE